MIFTLDNIFQLNNILSLFNLLLNKIFKIYYIFFIKILYY